MVFVSAVVHSRLVTPSPLLLLTKAQRKVQGYRASRLGRVVSEAHKLRSGKVRTSTPWPLNLFTFPTT